MFTFGQKPLKKGKTQHVRSSGIKVVDRDEANRIVRENRKRRKLLETRIELSEQISLTAIDLAKNLVLAGYTYEQIRKHMPDMPDQWWEDSFMPELSLHKERMNALAINAMYTSAIVGKTDAQKCIALMQLGWNADSGDPSDEDPREPFKVTLTASPKNTLGKLVDKMIENVDSDEYE